MTSISDEQAVRDAFVRWVSQQTGAPRDPESLIEDVEISHAYAGVLDTEIQGRRVVWRWVPTAAKARIKVPVIVLGDIDPWSIESMSLRRDSDHIAVCDACAGAKRLRCAACGGKGKTLCSACNGQRKTYGYATNGAYRLLNCEACRGKGEIDCAECRRGIAVCGTCAGEGRLQRWIEVESWQRSIANTHPQTFSRQFAWGETPTSEIVERDAEISVDLRRPHGLTPADLGEIPAQWLDVLAPPLMPGERVALQQLRIARIPTYRVHYRLGNNEDSVPFMGRRLVEPQSIAGSAFGLRIARLRSLRWLLIGIVIVIAVASLVRGAFFWRLPTFLTLFVCGAALVAVYMAAADWTAARRRTRQLLIAAAACLIIAIVFALAALPRIGHAQTLIAAGKVDEAESELHALGPKVDASLWADLRLARIRQASGIEAARADLAQIPRGLPQHTPATKAVDQLILQTARDDIRLGRLSDALGAVALLSPDASAQPESTATAAAACLPLARQRIERSDWEGAANVILTARRIRVGSAALEQLEAAIRAAAADVAGKAKRESDPGRRLRLRLAAEKIFLSWERATGNSETPSLIALRTAMAHDVATVERSERR